MATDDFPYNVSEEVDWDTIFNHFGRNIITDDMLEEMDIELLTKYYAVVQMQFWACDQMERNIKLASDPNYVITEENKKRFESTEQDLINLKAIVYRYTGIRDKMTELIRYHPISDEDFQRLFRNTLDNYKTTQN